MDGNRDDNPISKKRKLDQDTEAITINSPADLHQLLRQPSSPVGTKTALHQFKEFLNATTHCEDNNDHARRLQILRIYSEEQLPSKQQAVAFPDLITLWASAVDNNDESLLSSVPSVLALFLKTISGHLQFREIGLSLCTTLLLKDQLRLFDRALTATKTKKHLILPCLRLLTEMVSFDAGEIATLVYSKRDTTFRRLEVFLDHCKPSVDQLGNAGQKSTIRLIAQRYLLANLKYQSATAKREIIGQGKILRSSLQNLKNDGPDIVREFLITLEKDIVKAETLTKSFRRRLFTNSNLSSLASLYTFREPVNEVTPGRSVRELVDILLRSICTQSESGLLLPQNGWYPAGHNHDKSFALGTDPDILGLGIGSFSDAYYREKFPVKNAILANFILGLRPEKDRLQAALLLDIFRGAPELVADYFSKKINFISEPQETPAWLGQSGFLFSVINLPVPAYCGWATCYAPLPPPSAAVIESILPRPLDRQNTTRCLNLNHEVITLFAVRAVSAAFQKLRKVLEVYAAAPSNAESWSEASADLLSAFSRRCPLPKDLLSAWHRTPKSDEPFRGAIIELLAKYYRVLPHLMLLEKFDTSLALIDAIQRTGADKEDQSLISTRFSVLEHLLAIAQTSPDTKWWQKPDCLHYSVFTSMLTTILVADQSIPAIPSIRHLLQRIAAEHGVLPDRFDHFDALVTSLTDETNRMPSTKLLSYFDNCAGRIARQPVYYADLAAEMNASNAAVSLLPFCVAEQWNYVVQKEDPCDQEDIALWITRLFVFLAHAADNRDLIDKLHTQIVNVITDAALKRTIDRAYQDMLEDSGARLPATTSGQIDDQYDRLPNSGTSTTPVATVATLESQAKEMEFVKGLERVGPEDIEPAVTNGRLSRLCRSLSSPVEQIRRQGFMTLQGIMEQIKLSSYSEKGPLFILIGELTETARSEGLGSPLAAVCTQFAADAVEMLNQPSHSMYGKINRFLQKAPCWKASSFVPFWMGRVLLHEPEDDNGDVHETTWFLGLLIRGLQDSEDVELYRRSNVVDRVLAFHQSTLCSGTQHRQILELVNRFIELGGGMTLITRLGIESWLAIEQADGKVDDFIKQLGDQLRHRTSSAAIQEWKVPEDRSLQVI